MNTCYYKCSLMALSGHPKGKLMNLWHGLLGPRKMRSGWHLDYNTLLFIFLQVWGFALNHRVRLRKRILASTTILLASVIQVQNTNDDVISPHWSASKARVTCPQENHWKQHILMRVLLVGWLVCFATFQKAATNFWTPLSLSPGISMKLLG